LVHSINEGAMCHSMITTKKAMLTMSK
jgi:hypothetical protein